MIEFITTCNNCKKELILVAKTDEEIKALQNTFSQDRLCKECEYPVWCDE